MRHFGLRPDRIAPPTNPNPPTPEPPSSGPPSGEKENVYIANADGSGARLLTQGGQASWSPDGRRILFHRYPTASSPGEISVIDADGSNERQLFRGEWPSWSPDGKRIVFADEGRVEVVDADGSNDGLLISFNFRDDNNQSPGLPLATPVWSPDGKRIAFLRTTDWYSWTSRIFVVNVDGSNVHRLSMSKGGVSFAESDPAWSPDGKSIAYWSSAYGLAITDATAARPDRRSMACRERERNRSRLGRRTERLSPTTRHATPGATRHRSRFFRCAPIRRSC